MAETAGKQKGKPHPRNRFTAATVRKASPGVHADGGGLYLEVDKGGARRWFLRTMVMGVRKDTYLGPVDLISLAEVREQARHLRKVARDGGDPKAERDRHKRKMIRFEDAARTVWEENIAPNNRNAKHVAQWLSTLETYAFPTMGARPVHAVDQADVLKVLASIWTDKPETARRVRQRVRTVLDWARAAGHREGVNPVEGVEKALPRQKDRAKHHAAFPWRDMCALMPRIAAAKGMGAVALRFCILTAARSGEVRGATWGEMDLDAGVWTIPADRMKGGREHRVPLSAEAMAALRLAKAMADRPGDLAFPSTKPGRPLSDMTLAAVLKRLDVPATVHGFRSTFRDWSEEATSFPHEVKEAALAHAVRNRVEAAYRRTDLFEKRRAMMDAWESCVMGAGATVRRIGA